MRSSPEAVSLLAKWKRDRTPLKFISLQRGETLTTNRSGFEAMIAASDDRHLKLSIGDGKLVDCFPFEDMRLGADGKSVELTFADGSKQLLFEI